MKKTLYHIELTDMYGGEANYSWVTRCVIAGTSERGAINRFMKLAGLNGYRRDMDSGDLKRYVSKSRCTCFFIEAYDEDRHGQHTFKHDDRPPFEVVFRKFRSDPLKGEVVALLCHTADSCKPGYVMSYMHVGQHGEAHRSLGRDLPLATPDEYAPLKRELERIYNREVIPVNRLVAK